MARGAPRETSHRDTETQRDGSADYPDCVTQSRVARRRIAAARASERAEKQGSYIGVPCVFAPSLARTGGRLRRPTCDARQLCVSVSLWQIVSARSRVSVLSKRVIACLDVRNGQVVKGVNFEGLRSAGDPAELARRYNAEGIDELVILDITATLEARRALAAPNTPRAPGGFIPLPASGGSPTDADRAPAGTVAGAARELFIPLAVGGGIRTEADAAAAVDAGADKVSLNTAALADPPLITRVAERYGSQAVLVAIDAKREAPGSDRFA